MTNEEEHFLDWYYDWVTQYCNEVTSPNQPDWEELHDMLLDDEVQMNKVRKFYNGKSR